MKLPLMLHHWPSSFILLILVAFVSSSTGKLLANGVLYERKEKYSIASEPNYISSAQTVNECAQACFKHGNCTIISFLPSQFNLTNNCHHFRGNEVTRPWEAADVNVYYQVLASYQQFGLIRHNAGLCIRSNPISQQLQLEQECDEEYEITNGRIYKRGTTKCWKPFDSSASSIISLSDDCDSSLAQFSFTDDNRFYQQETGFCVHQQGGNLNPSTGTSLVVFYGCNDSKLIYGWM